MCALTGREDTWAGAGSAEVPMARYSRAVIVWNFVWFGVTLSWGRGGSSTAAGRVRSPSSADFTA